MSIKFKKRKYLGKLTVSATGLRRMANYLQKKAKTKNNVSVKCYIEDYDEYKTLGILIGKLRP